MRITYAAIFLVLPLCLSAANEHKPASVETGTTKGTASGDGGIAGFFKGLNKKSADLKHAVDKAAGNDNPSAGTTITGAQIPTSAAPIFDNDSAQETTDARIREVLARGGEWGDLGANTSGFKTLNAANLGTLQGFGPTPWRASKAECVAVLSERGAVMVNTSKGPPGVEILNFQGGSFAGQLAQAWQLFFFQDRLFEARVEYVYPKGGVLREYRKMLSALEAKYGRRSGEQDLRFLYLDLDVNYESKKWNSRGDEEKHWFYLMRLDAWYAQALAAQSAQPMSKWQFVAGDTLTFWISARSKMMLQYRYSALAEEASGFAKKASSAEKDL